MSRIPVFNSVNPQPGRGAAPSGQRLNQTAPQAGRAGRPQSQDRGIVRDFFDERREMQRNNLTVPSINTHFRMKKQELRKEKELEDLMVPVKKRSAGRDRGYPLAPIEDNGSGPSQTARGRQKMGSGSSNNSRQSNGNGANNGRQNNGYGANNGRQNNGYGANNGRQNNGYGSNNARQSNGYGANSGRQSNGHGGSGYTGRSSYGDNNSSYSVQQRRTQPPPARQPPPAANRRTSVCSHSVSPSSPL